MRDYKDRYAVPQDDSRGCLCWDSNTYSRECCDDDYHAQGIGNITGLALSQSLVTIASLSVSQGGGVSTPTANYKGADLGTVTVTPTTFAPVVTDTPRSITSSLVVPESVVVNSEEVKFSNKGDTVSKTETITQPANVSVALSCSDITFTGFAVSQAGVITQPTIDIGTISSTTPLSFALVSTETTRTLNVNITVPSGYTNAGATLACTTTATQPIATLSNPVTTNPYKYLFTGYPTGIVIYRFAYNTAGDFIDIKGIKGELGQSSGITISSFSKPEIVDGNTSGLTMTETEDASLALAGAVMANSGTDIQYFSSSLFTTQQTGTPNVSTVSYTNNANNVASNYGLYDSTNSIGIGVYTNTLASIPVSDATLLNQALADGYYTGYNNPKQVRIEDGVIQEVLDI